jgi:hypothetical protein
VQRGNNEIGPEAGPVLPNPPALVFRAVLGGRLLEETIGFALLDILRWMETGEMPPDDFSFFVMFETARAAVPTGDVPFWV